MGGLGGSVCGVGDICGLCVAAVVKEWGPAEEVTQFNYTDASPRADYQHPLGERERGFRPLGDRILVRRVAGERNVSSLYVPECAEKISVRGIVVACGPGRRCADGFRRPLDVKPGDVIEFGRFTDFDDGELLLIQEADVVGIVSSL